MPWTRATAIVFDDLCGSIPMITRRLQYRVPRVVSISVTLLRIFIFAELGRSVYHRCMGRTNIDIDDDACRQIMDRYQLATKREAVNLALRRLVGEALDLDDARALRGSGWHGDLADMRASRAE